MVDFDDLTDEQRAAADALDRNVTLTAGAGTGKTTTLTARYVRMLERGLEADTLADSDGPLLPEEIVTTTFTERAANELKASVREAITERVADADAETHRQWRRVADGLDDGYVHTLHGFCARLLRENALTASSVDPGFDTLDERETAALLADTVAGLLETHDGHDAVRTLSRRFDRNGLQDVLTDLLTERPGSLEWAERWADATPDEYLEYVNAELHPVPPKLAAERLAHPQFVEAVGTLRDLLASPPAELDVGGSSWNRAMGVLDRLDSVAYGDGGPTIEVRECFVDLCDHLTTGDGDRYDSYDGAAGRWSGAEDEKADFDAAMETIVAVIEPENHLVPASIEIDERSFPFVRSLARLTLLAHGAYAERKRRENVVDFTDLIEFALEFLREDASDERRRALRSQFAYVMVDEFQDTDPRQWDIVRHLVAVNPDDFDAENVFVVGDAKQSIYRFRNADVTGFDATARELELANLPRPTATDAADDQLSTNFRTLPGVLGFVDELFDEVFEADGPAYETEPQPLDAHRDDPADLAAVEYLAVPTDEDYRARRFEPDHDVATARVEHPAELEGMALAARLSQLFAEPAQIYDEDGGDDPDPRDVEPGDVAILLRSRTHLKTYERALEDANIPFTVASGLGFYETPEVTALVNLLRALADPADERALYGALRSPLFGLTDDTLAMLKRDGQPLWDALGDTAAAETELVDGPANELADAYDLLTAWRSTVGLGESPDPRFDGSWAAFLSRVIDDTGYLASVSADERPQQAVANVEKFREELRGFADGVTSLPTLVDRIERRRSLGTREGEATVQGGGDGVRILTVHDAKGLEFPVVAVPGIGHGFNLKAAVGNGRVEFEEMDDGYAVGVKAPDPDDAFEMSTTVAREAIKERRMAEERAEEKRVLYVACTRARDRLLLTGVHDFETADGEATMRNVNDADPEAAGSWRDWVQPHVLPEETLDALKERDRVTGTLGDASFTVSLPTPPTDWSDDAAVPESEGELSSTPPQPGLQFSLSATELRHLSEGRGSLRVDERTNVASYEAEEDAESGERDAEPGETDTELNEDSEDEDEGLGDADDGENDMYDSDGEGDMDDSDGEGEGDTDDGEREPIAVESGVFGTMVHRLCELRPPDDRWDEVMERTYAAEDADGELTPADCERVREHAERAMAFVDDLHRTCEVEYAYDELRVVVEFDDGEVSGLIDHLVVTPDAYHVVDYKTSDVGSDEVKEKADTYRAQLEAYALALHQQDPDREVQGVLYFTTPGEEHRSWWTPSGLEDLETELLERIHDELR